MSPHNTCRVHLHGTYDNCRSSDNFQVKLLCDRPCADLFKLTYYWKVHVDSWKCSIEGHLLHTSRYFVPIAGIQRFIIAKIGYHGRKTILEFVRSKFAIF